MSKREYDSTVARIAGNILSGHPHVLGTGESHQQEIAATAVKLARMVVAEVKRTEPKDPA